MRVAGAIWKENVVPVPKRVHFRIGADGPHVISKGLRPVIGRSQTGELPHLAVDWLGTNASAFQEEDPRVVG